MRSSVWMADMGISPGWCGSLPELRQMLAVRGKVIVKDQPGCLDIGDDGVEQQTLERLLAVALDGGIYAQLGDEELAAAQLRSTLRQRAHMHWMHAGTVHVDGRLDRRAEREVADLPGVGQVGGQVIVIPCAGHVLDELEGALGVRVQQALDRQV